MLPVKGTRVATNAKSQLEPCPGIDTLITHRQLCVTIMTAWPSLNHLFGSTDRKLYRALKDVPHLPTRRFETYSTAAI